MRHRGGKFLVTAATVGLLAATVGAAYASSTTHHVRASHSALSNRSGGWTWKVHPGDVSDGIACPTTKLCVGAQDGPDVRWTKNPTANKPHWSAARIASSTSILTAISCPTSHFCLATDDEGDTFSSTNPTGGRSAWHEADIDQIELLAVSCSSPSLCAGVDYYGNALVSTDPGAPGPSWHSTSLEPMNGQVVQQVSCAGHSVCAIVVGDKKIYYTTSASAATPRWQHVTLPGHGWDGIACPTASKCVAVGTIDFNAKVAVTTRLAGGRHTWKLASFKRGASNFGLYNVDCASASHCFAIGNLSTTHLAAKTSAWRSTTIKGIGSETDVSCATPKWCFISDSVNDFIAGHR
jgi:hypothetical protein